MALFLAGGLIISGLIFLKYPILFASRKEKEFIKRCNSLNGKNFTLENFLSLGGYCRICNASNNSVTKKEFCRESHFEEIQLINQLCRNQFQSNQNSSIDCYKKILEQYENFIFYPGTLQIDFDDADHSSTWSCVIKKIDPKIETAAIFFD